VFVHSTGLRLCSPAFPDLLQPHQPQSSQVPLPIRTSPISTPHPVGASPVSTTVSDKLLDVIFGLLWETFWGMPTSACVVEQEVQVPDSRTLEIPMIPTKFKYLELPGRENFPCGFSRILITETYTSFYAELCNEDSRWASSQKKPLPFLATSHSTVITGQPGIG